MSVIIPSYDSEKTILDCVGSILIQKVEFKFEIIVVDSSEDDIEAIIIKRFPQVKVIKLKQRAFPAEARNTGIKAASGAIIAFIDADCVACRDWLEKIYQSHQSEYAAAGGSILNGEDRRILSWAEYFLEFTEFLPFSPLREVRTIPTCNISYKKKVFEKYGYFPLMRTAEDARFNWHLVENGERILFDPSIKIIHMHIRKFKSFLKNQTLLGRGFAESRIQTDIPGNMALKYLLPLLFVVKFWLITKRIIKWNRQLLIELIKCLPFIVVGLTAWQYGVISAFTYNKLLKPSE